MKTTKILESEIQNLKISSLPSRPTAPASFGGKGYTAKEMKAAFDKLPLFIIERLNSLIADIQGTGDESIASDIKTGIYDTHTLHQFFEDLKNGDAAEYFTVGSESLIEYAERIADILTELEKKIHLASQNFLECISDDVYELTPQMAKIYRMGEISGLTVTVPDEVSDEYFSELCFDSGEDATEFYINGILRLTGDDVADEIFIPAPNKHYTVFLWYDGQMQGVVRGISNA